MDEMPQTLAEVAARYRIVDVVAESPGGRFLVFDAT